MKSVKVYNLEGNILEEISLNPIIFAAKINQDTVHQTVVAQLANARHAISNTLTKGEVRGGGKKPWAQKHTGRARQGSIRAPQWRKGGIIFGPCKEKNFSVKISKNIKKNAIRSVLSDKVNDSALYIVDNFDFKDFKTKNAIEFLAKMLVNDKKVLICLDEKGSNAELAFRNLPKVIVLPVNSLNVKDLLNASAVILSKQGLSTIEKVYLK